MKPSARNLQNGIVAILDALGAASYSDEEIGRFMRSREIVIQLLGEKSESVTERLSVDRITTFTFNDTVLIVLKGSGPTVSSDEVKAFFTVLRKFVTDSLANGILFRGSVAIGRFSVDALTNTIMGQAVTDAAAWYDKADWVGVVATPKSTLLIEKMLEKKGRDWLYLMLEYDVPLKTGKTMRLKVVNWPKVFFVNSIRPCEEGKEREKLLEFLSQHNVPFGTEGKFFNTLAFFDHAHKLIAKDAAKKESKPNK